MGLASLLRAQRERGGAGDGAGGADHGAGPPLLRFFVAAPLHVGWGVVVRPRRTGDNGSDVVALPRTGRLLLHGRALKTEKHKYKSNSLYRELIETQQHLDEILTSLCYTCVMIPSFPGCLSSSLGMRWMERPGSFTVGTRPSRPFIGSASGPGPRGGEFSLFICLASLLR